jgi:uncharacterized repeat protein (TIGR03803 family)
MKAQKIMAPVVALIVVAGTSHAQMLTALHTFSASTNMINADGANPICDLTLSGKTLYGLTANGGSNGIGMIFSMNTDGSDYTVLHVFAEGPGGDSFGPHLTLSGGTLYGSVGGAPTNGDYGDIYSVETNGSNFSIICTITNSSDGIVGVPRGGLLVCSNTLYGTAFQGGITNAGTIFSADTNGNFQLLHQFQTDTDGRSPVGTLVLSSNVLYGMTFTGGTNPGNFGTIYSISTGGTNFKVLHTFGGITNGDGSSPNAGLIVSGNMLYGATSLGGTSNHGTVFSLNTDGSCYTVLHSFAGLGQNPQGTLRLHGGTLYGAALGNGTTTEGSVYSISTNGSNFTLLQTFSHLELASNDTNTFGALPRGGLAMVGNVLYGTTSSGGVYGNGTIFSLAIQPVISSLNLDGTNAVLNAANGFAGDTWSVLESSDLTLPLAEWTPVATNTLSVDGNFSITATNAVNPEAAQGFYVLQQK